MKNNKSKTIGNAGVMRSPIHQKYYVTNIIGGLTDQDFRFELLNEKIKNEHPNQWAYVSDAMIILSPIGAKKLFEKLKETLNVYENEKGKILIQSNNEHIINVRK